MRTRRVPRLPAAVRTRPWFCYRTMRARRVLRLPAAVRARLCADTARMPAQPTSTAPPAPTCTETHYWNKVSSPLSLRDPPCPPPPPLSTLSPSLAPKGEGGPGSVTRPSLSLSLSLSHSLSLLLPLPQTISLSPLPWTLLHSLAPAWEPPPPRYISSGVGSVRSATPRDSPCKVCCSSSNPSGYTDTVPRSLLSLNWNMHFRDLSSSLIPSIFYYYMISHMIS